MSGGFIRRLNRAAIRWLFLPVLGIIGDLAKSRITRFLNNRIDSSPSLGVAYRLAHKLASWSSMHTAITMLAIMGLYICVVSSHIWYMGWSERRNPTKPKVEAVPYFDGRDHCLVVKNTGTAGTFSAFIKPLDVSCFTGRVPTEYAGVWDRSGRYESKIVHEGSDRIKLVRVERSLIPLAVNLRLLVTEGYTERDSISWSSVASVKLKKPYAVLQVTVASDPIMDGKSLSMVLVAGPDGIKEIGAA